MKTEAKVGAFVLVCMAILLATVYRVSSAQIKGARVSYRTYLRYAGGLEEGADVLFGGIKVGTVTAVHPDAHDPTRIEILMDVRLGTPLNAKSVAKLGSVTVITSPVISISMGSNDAPRLEAGAEIPAEETISLDDTERKIVALADSARTLLDSVQTDVNGITGDARKLIANLNDVTGDANRQHIAEILTNADAMITRISPKIDQISDDALKLTTEANGLMADAHGVMTRVGPVVDNANATVSNANETITALREPLQADLAEVRKTLDQARSLIGDLQVAMRAKDQNITDTVENVRMVTDNLNELTESLKERPWSLIRIKQPKDRKVPQ
jgi:phospholipid/cholesterol/gamma-HCH transport system substrate-binding protein